MHTTGILTVMPDNDPFARSSLFEASMQEILRPLAKALIDQGVTAPAFYKIVKQAYIDAAVEALGPGATDSRASIVTGVHRREVKALRAAKSPQDTESQRKVSRLATVVGLWMSNPDYHDATGAPRPLPRTAEDAPSFDSLVETVSKDIRPRTVLDELTRQGLVSEDAGMITLAPDALVGPSEIGQQIHFFERNLADHLSAAVGNLNADTPVFFERAAFFNALEGASVDAVEDLAREAGLTALHQVAASASQHQNTDRNTSDATHRFRFGMYFYREDERGDQSPPSPSPKTPDTPK